LKFIRSWHCRRLKISITKSWTDFHY